MKPFIEKEFDTDSMLEFLLESGAAFFDELGIESFSPYTPLAVLPLLLPPMPITAVFEKLSSN